MNANENANAQTIVSETNQLLDAVGLLKAVFPEDCRPTVRWLRDQQKRRALPFVKLGHLVFFDPVEVRAAIQKRHTIQARGAR